VVGDFDEFATGGGDNPNVFVVTVFEFFAGAVGDEGEAGAVGGPLGISVVPVFAGGDLPGDSIGSADNPEMASFVIEPAGVIELVGDVLLVADIAFLVGGSDGVTGPGLANGDEAVALGGPLIGGNAILHAGDRESFAAVHAHDVDLWAASGFAAIGEEGEAGAIGRPAGRVGVKAFGGQAARGSGTCGGYEPGAKHADHGLCAAADWIGSGDQIAAHGG
jgi:hypothetical protein